MQLLVYSSRQLHQYLHSVKRIPGVRSLGKRQQLTLAALQPPGANESIDKQYRKQHLPGPNLRGAPR
jgi:hypothetical protein